MMRKMVLSRGGALLGAVACLASVSLAVPAAASASVTSLTSCQTISAPGTYRLDANLTVNAPGADCFKILAGGVALLLNGHTIQQGSVEALDGIEVKAADAKILGPGTLTGFEGDGIELESGNATVRGITASGNTLGNGIEIVGGGNDVRGSVFKNNGAFGIAVDGTGNTIIGNFAHNNDLGPGSMNLTDVLDANANCDSNVWRGNDFGTANESCIH